MTQIKEIYSGEQINRRVAELGAEISRDYEKLECPVVIGVLKGALFFLSDLVRYIKLPQSMQLEFVHLSSYGDATESSGIIQTPYLSLPNITNRHILVVEDIVESGRTANFLLEYLKDQFMPASLKLAVMLNRTANRVVTIEPDYVGFSAGDRFIVGYGFDLENKYREAPFLGELIVDDTKG